MGRFVIGCIFGQAFSQHLYDLKRNWSERSAWDYLWRRLYAHVIIYTRAHKRLVLSTAVRDTRFYVGAGRFTTFGGGMSLS